MGGSFTNSHPSLGDLIRILIRSSSGDLNHALGVTVWPRKIVILDHDLM